MHIVQCTCMCVYVYIYICIYVYIYIYISIETCYLYGMQYTISNIDNLAKSA